MNIHGHEHGKPLRMSPHINVSVEQLEYEPISLTKFRASGARARRGAIPAGQDDDRTDR